MKGIDGLAEPDWDSPLQITLTPEQLAKTLMETATAVHTGWESCVQEDVVLNQIVAMDDRGQNFVRLVEQEFADDEDVDVIWHDWALEICIGRVMTIGHWHLRNDSPPVDWDWHARQAERAFQRACVLLGRRARRGLWVEEVMPQEVPPRARQH
ncbi:hypothetical protein CKO36_15860 [Rhabdochromatium marinum]|nr:hypothetical protein [Rhabdochromatium marinum]